MSSMLRSLKSAISRQNRKDIRKKQLLYRKAEELEAQMLKEKREKEEAIFKSQAEKEESVESEPEYVVHDGTKNLDSIFTTQPHQKDEFIKPDLYSLKHHGTPHDGAIPHSGRYEWGSGSKPGQHESWFAGFGEDAYDLNKRYNGYYSKYINDLKKQGLTEAQIAKGMGIDVKTLKARVSMSSAAYRAAQASEVARILASDPTISNVQIGKIMGINESQVRNLRNPEYLKKANSSSELADYLKQRVDEKGYIDVGSGAEEWLNVKRTKLETACAALKEQGYILEKINQEQVGNPGKYTTILVLAKPGETQSSIWKNRDKISTITEVDINDEGGTLLGLKYPPKSLDSSRLLVKYAEDGGEEKDGTIELRRGVEDISLGDSKYAQVRIAVDGTHYLKGMAIYSDDMPEGIDVVFNTNKKRGTPIMADDPDASQVLKPLKINSETGEVDKDNPFGATIKRDGQRTYLDENGEIQLSVINKVNEEGDWGAWKKTIASQMLSKQPLTVAAKQLDLAYDTKKAELDSIKSLTNPVVKKQLLEEYADSCDSAAVDLKAAALPRQASHVIIPINTMADNEVYAPKYENGEKVILIRYPHAGTFEIPQLTVNNNNETAKKVLGQAADAIGINHNVAARLSGADFDGDTVLVIPNNTGSLLTSKPLKELVGFEPKNEYPGYEGMHVMTDREKGIEMGKVSNLITDMTIQDAPLSDIAKAVKHSMVVIDAKKHKLNYEKSFVDNDIASLYKEYQGKKNGGASTLISKASGEARIPERKEGIFVADPVTGKTKKQYIDPSTGEKLYRETGRTYLDKNGKEHLATIKTTNMAKTKDANTLLSNDGIGTPIERAYARYANQMKALGNEARKESLAVKYNPINKTARDTYKGEVASLTSKLAIAKKHAPLERQAQLLADATVQAKVRENPSIKEDKDAYKKYKAQALSGARNRFGGGKSSVDISPKEWEAINSGAIASSTLLDIVKHTDSKVLKSLALPKENRGLTSSQEKLIESMANRGYTMAEIANQLGVSSSTVSNVLNG